MFVNSHFPVFKSPSNSIYFIAQPYEELILHEIQCMKVTLRFYFF